MFIHLTGFREQPGPAWPPSRACSNLGHVVERAAAEVGTALPCIDITFCSNAKHIFTSELIIPQVQRRSVSLLLKDNLIGDDPETFLLRNQPRARAGSRELLGSSPTAEVSPRPPTPVPSPTRTPPDKLLRKALCSEEAQKLQPDPKESK